MYHTIVPTAVMSYVTPPGLTRSSYTLGVRTVYPHFSRFPFPPPGTRKSDIFLFLKNPFDVEKSRTIHKKPTLNIHAQ